MFVSNKKQQSGLLENSIRNARRRASGKRRSTPISPDKNGQDQEEDEQDNLEDQQPSTSTITTATATTKLSIVNGHSDDEDRNGILLSQNLLNIKIDELLINSTCGVDTLMKLVKSMQLERSDYLYMANLIRDPIMKFCEK